MKTVNLATIGCPSYSVTTEGDVIGQKGESLTPFPHERDGRLMVVLQDWRGRKKKFALARLVLNSFRESRGLESVPEHVNGDVTDCRSPTCDGERKPPPTATAC